MLTKFEKLKKGSKRVESDHHPILSKLNFKWSKTVPKNKNEIFNLKNVDGQLKFKEVTSNTDFLSSVFDDSNNIDVITKKFLKRLNGCLHQSFQKINISDKDDTEIDKLMDRRRALKANPDDKSKEELKDVENELAS